MRSVVDLRFGVSLAGWTDGPALLAAAPTAEREGFDTVTVADHLGHAAPFAALAAAAAVTSRVRLRTYVLDAYFWNPALLAREVATLDLLSGGRCELGIGAGHMRHEHVDAGLPFPPVGERWEHTVAVLTEVRRRLADEPRSCGGAAARAGDGRGDGRARAARRGRARRRRRPGGGGAGAGPAGGTFTLTDAATTDERVGLVREVAAAHGRAPELDVLLQQVVLDADPEETAAAAAREAAQHGMDWLVPELLLDTPFVLFAASAEDAAAELARREQRWGVRSWSTHAPWGPALARVAAAARS